MWYKDLDVKLKMNNFNIKYLKKFKKPFGKFKLSGFRLEFNCKSDYDYALKSLTYGKLTSKEIESARRAIRKVTKKLGKIAIRVYPYLPLTKKPAEVRMGKGKGSKIRDWVYPTRPGKTLFEISGIPETLGLLALNKAKEKLSIKCKIINLRKI